jgi:hypothetical protein
MSPQQIEYVRNLLLLALVIPMLKAILGMKTSYHCPACGSGRANEHDPECPWREQ